MNQSPLNKNRNDKFVLAMNLPEALKTINDNTVRSSNKMNLESLEMSVYGAVTPSINVTSLPIKYGAQSIKVSSHVREPLDDLSLTFSIDNEYKNYWVIYKWLDLINDVSASFFNQDGIAQVANRESMVHYSTNMSLFGLDEYENKKIRFDYIGAFPSSLSEISWSYGDSAEIKASASFGFTKMEVELL